MNNSLDTLLANSSDSYKYNTMQIAAFKILNSDTTFGINVNKVVSFVRWEDCTISFNVGAKTPALLGIVNIRNKTYPLIAFEEWLGIDYDKNEYKNIILCEFNQHIMAFPIKSIQRIYTKASDELEKSELFEGKISYITKIDKENFKNEKLQIRLAKLKRKVRINDKRTIDSDFSKNKKNNEQDEILSIENELSKLTKEKTEELCLILDVESLLADLFSIDENILKNSMNKFKTHFTKKILIAEDSRAAISILKKILEPTNVQAFFFTNGQELLNYLKTTDISNIGFILSDIEMPEMDGFTLLKNIKEKYPEIPVIMNSSMSNKGVNDKIDALGGEGFIPKTNPDQIISFVNKYC